MAGKSAHVEVIAANARGVVYGRKSYDVPPFAQRVVALDTVLDRLERADVTISVTSGEGKVAVGKETRDPAMAKLALHHAAAETSVRVVSVQSSGAVTPLLLLCPFKAAPFMDPATGLCLMRDRWYDPKTGTFLTPDRAGYRDSSNLYIFGKADPVNNHDPTGMTVALWGTQHQKDAAYKRLVGTLDNPAAVAHLTIDKQHRVAVTGISIDDFIKRYEGRARQLGQMIDSSKTVYLTEVQSTTPIASPFKRDELLQDKIERGGGGFFDTFDHAHGLAAFNPDLFPRDVADVTETSDATFAHEFFGHAYAWSVPYGAMEAQTGTISQKYVYNAFTGGIGAGEADGLWAENTYRLQHQMRLRTYYLRARDDWNAPAWLAPYIQKQREADVLRADQEAERRRQQLLQHNIWHWPGLR